MYFYIDCLQKKGKFGLIWVAAFERADYRKRSTQFLIKSYDIERSCDEILRYTIEGRENSPKMNLYVTATLLSGLTKVFREKAIIVLRDTANVFIKWGEIARSLSIRDVKLRKIRQSDDPEQLDASISFLALQERYHSGSYVELYDNDIAKKSGRKGKQKVIQENQEIDRVIEANALAEMLRAADADIIHENVFDPREIAIGEVPSLPPDQSFGGSALESTALEIQGPPKVVESEIEANLDLSIHPETIETVAAPPPADEKDIADIIQSQLQVPDIEVQKRMDVTESIESVLVEMLEADESRIEGGQERREELELPRKVTRDAKLEFSMDKLKERCTNFHNLMRHVDPRQDCLRIPKNTTKTGTPEWIIPEELRIAAHLIPKCVWPPVHTQHVVKLPVLGQKLQQLQEVEGEAMEVQRFGDGDLLKDISMELRPSFGSPTPKILSREARIRATPSPSPIGKDVQRSFPEANICTILEPISETAVIDPSELLQPDIEQLQELLVQPMEKIHDTIVEEEPSPAKRPRLDTKSSSSEQSIVTLSISYENKLKSSLAEIFAHSETATFQDVAPPSTTTRRTAAHLFSALLDLEKKQELKTQQDEPFGKIIIYPIQPNI